MYKKNSIINIGDLMKKESFLKGALISTVCIILSKILGIIYVIPFHAVIGEKGGALYSYAYTIYNLFLTLSTVGLPLAISKIVSEYNTLDYQDAKKRSYKIALRFTLCLSIVSSISLFIFAPVISSLIKGGVEGGNSVSDIVFVLRIASTAIFFATILSTTRGYLQGHRYISVSSISQIIEQFVRVLIIIFGSYVGIKLFGLKEAVGIAVFGATAGAMIAYVYLKFKIKKIRSNSNYVIKNEERKISNKYLFRKLIKYTIPFVMTSVIASLYDTVDTFTIVKGLIKYGNMDVDSAEAVLGIIATWGNKLNMIVTSIASGIVVSLLPNLTSDFVAKNMKGVNEKIIKTFELLLYLVIPMAVGLSVLSTPVWKTFYGNSELGPSVFKFSVFVAIFSSTFINVNVVMQSLNRYKTVFISLISGVLFKAIFNVPLIYLYSRIGITPYYASISATIIGFSISILISLIDLKKNFGIKYNRLIKNVIICILSILVVVVLIKILSLFIVFSSLSRVKSIFLVAICSIIGALIYFILTYKNKVFETVFGKNVIKKIPFLKGV